MHGLRQPGTTLPARVLPQAMHALSRLAREPSPYQVPKWTTRNQWATLPCEGGPFFARQVSRLGWEKLTVRGGCEARRDEGPAEVVAGLLPASPSPEWTRELACGLAGLVAAGVSVPIPRSRKRKPSHRSLTTRSSLTRSEPLGSGPFGGGGSRARRRCRWRRASALTAPGPAGYRTLPARAAGPA